MAQTSCGYYGTNELGPDTVRNWGSLVKTGKVWFI